MLKKRAKPKRARKKRSKPIKLNPLFWLRHSDEIQAHREMLEKAQKGKCAITKSKLVDPALDHSHDTANVRCVLNSQVNMLEGRYKSLFKKAGIERKFDISFPDFLIGMGKYLSKDYSDNLLHFAFMSDFRKKVKRWKKDKLLLQLKKDFAIILPPSTLQEDLVQEYVQAWVDEIESKLKYLK